MTEKELEVIREAVEVEIEAAVAFAHESPYPDASELYEDLYVDGGIVK